MITLENPSETPFKAETRVKKTMRTNHTRDENSALLGTNQSDCKRRVIGRVIGIGRPIRIAMVAAALREVGITSPTILPVKQTRR